MTTPANDDDLKNAWMLFEQTVKDIQKEQLEAFEETLTKLDAAEIDIKRNHVLRCYDDSTDGSAK